MATITNTVKLYSEKGIERIITLNRNTNTPIIRGENLSDMPRHASSKLPAAQHLKDLSAELIVCWRNKQKLCLMFQTVKIPLAGLKKINFCLT